MDKTEIRNDATWLGARLREPSTYAGLAALLGLIHLSDVPAWAAALSDIGMGVGAVIAIVLPEKKPAQ